MREKILELLKTKFVGVKEEILDRMATKAAKNCTNEDDVTNYVEGVTIQSIIDGYGDSRATDAVKTAVANYEKKHNIKDGKPVEGISNGNKGDDHSDDMPAWAKALMEQNKALNDRLSAFDNEKTAKTRQSKLADVLKDCPEKVKALYEKDFARLNFENEEDFDTWLGSTKTNVEEIANDFKASQAAMTAPKAGGAPTNGKVNPIVQARIDAAAKAAAESPANTAIKG